MFFALRAILFQETIIEESDNFQKKLSKYLCCFIRISLFSNISTTDLLIQKCEVFGEKSSGHEISKCLDSRTEFSEFI